MRLNWYTISDYRHHNTGPSVLWSEQGYYAWTNYERGIVVGGMMQPQTVTGICIDFYSRPPNREVTRIGTFEDDNRVTRIADAEDAVEADMKRRTPTEIG